MYNLIIILSSISEFAQFELLRKAPTDLWDLQQKEDSTDLCRSPRNSSRMCSTQIWHLKAGLEIICRMQYICWGRRFEILYLCVNLCVLCSCMCVCMCFCVSVPMSVGLCLSVCGWCCGVCVYVCLCLCLCLCKSSFNSNMTNGFQHKCDKWASPKLQ